MNNQKDYISYLRVIATIAVIVLHTVGFISMDYGNVNDETWALATFINSSVRFCVPVFIMISGALLLGKYESVKLFITKRLNRIFIPFIFWSLIYTCWYYKDRLLSFDIELLKVFINNLLNGSAYHLWYLYMIIGLYAFIPILRKFTVTASKRSLEYLLVVSFIVMLARQYGISQITISFINFDGYIFYLILGYYLSKFGFTYINAIIYFLVVIFTFLMTYYLSHLENRFYTGYTLYQTFNVAIMSTSLFLLMKYWQPKMLKLVKLIEHYSFGIYFIHVVVLHYVYKILYSYVYIESVSISILLFIFLCSLFTLFISTVIIISLSKIPILKRLIM